MTKLPHTPVSKAPTTEGIDETWDDTDMGVPREPSAPPEGGDAHGIPTAAPSIPPEALEIAAMLHTSPATRTGWMDDSRFATPTPVAPTEAPESASRLAALNRNHLANRPVRKSSAPTIEIVELTAPAARADCTSNGGTPGADAAPRTKTPEPAKNAALANLLQLDSVKPDAPRSSAPPEDLEQQIEEALGGSPLDLVNSRTRKVGARSAGDDVSIPEPPPESASDTATVKDLRDRYALGDFTGALILAESILETDPGNEHAKRYAQSCREVLMQMYAARLSPLDQLVTVTIPPEQITWLSLDHRAGFLLSLVDGVSTVDEILDISGMSRLEAMRIMYTLLQQNVIALG